VPFQADTLAGIMQHHFFTPVPDIRTARDDVPTALLDVLHVALAKDPAARFTSTRDMLTAIEAVPLSEPDRRESERQLRLLASGGTVAKVATRELPALPDSPTQALTLPPVSGRQTRIRARVRVVAGAAAAAAVIGGAWWASRADGTPPRASRQDSVPAPAPLPKPPAETPVDRSEGRLRLLTSPTDAEIFIDGVKVGEGSVVDRAVATGNRRLRVVATGYETFDTTIVIQRGVTLNLGRIALRGRDGGA